MSNNLDSYRLLDGYGLLVPVLAAVVSAVLLILLHPLLRRFALARPNARSSHREPTPQGGGIGVVGATIIVVALAAFSLPVGAIDPIRLAWILAAAAALTFVGATDDVRPMEAVPRLLLQALIGIVVIATLPSDLRIFPIQPWWLERVLLVVGSVWFINLVNFMDGIDWMTVAEVVPLTAGLALFGLTGELPWEATLVSLALCGAMIGFAPFNRPVARLFLGDLGSLPIGLLLGWLLTLLAGRGHLAAALLLPLYYLADTTITLLRRFVNGESIMQAHRSHFYQRAMDGGFSVYKIVGLVFGTNIVLVGLATATILNTSPAFHVSILVFSTALVGALLWNFNRASR